MKVKYDVKGVEAQGDRPLVKPGIYKIRVDTAPVTQPEGKGVRIEMNAKIVGGDYDGLALRTYYVNLDREDLMWKVKGVQETFSLPESGSFDDKTLVGKVGRARIKSKMDDEWGAQNEIATLLPPEDDDAEPEDGAEPEAEPDESGEDAGLTWSDLADWDRAALKTFIKDAELGALAELGITAKTTDDEIRIIIADALEIPHGDDEPEAEPEDEPEAEPEDEPEAEPEDDGLDELDRTALKKIIKDEELGSLADLGINTKTTDDEIRDKIRTARGGAEPEPEAEPEAAPDYNAMTLPELKAELVKRGLSDKGKKEVLVARLNKDDAPF